ncbi:exonuclease domain-containing protein [Bacillus sp. EB600]|uniref:exonuclease domain-containing protein n=1 Tax=Bacillus sp. EB600 TaxID=2806345 RepID=UPI00210ACCEA|nr:exonuclease domain-containing protein [Bacillus sp. EB600]MCQ6281944.1 3'-5' exoribonuclease [Bacillus sp. EB600]
MGMNELFQFFKDMSGKFNSNIYAGIRGQSNPQHISFLRQLQKELNKKNNLDTPLETLKVVVFDLETTGFYPEKGDQAISIGAIKMCGATIEEGEEASFYSLIKSDKPIPNEISALTNIHNDELAAAPIALEVLLKFYKFINGSILVAHHSSHEKAFMQKMTWDILRTRFEHRLIDTAFLIRLFNSNMKSFTLDEVCKECGVEIKDRHHALGDAKMTAQIWSYYVRRAQKMGIVTLREVYEQITKG